MDTVRDDLRVGFRHELVAQLGQVGAQLGVIFDDAVMDDRQTVVRDVRVRVALGGGAVGRPTGVGNTDLAPRRLLFDGLLERADLADGPQAHQVAGAVQDGETGRIVAPILQSSQSLQEDGDDVAFGYCSNDSAHVKESRINR